MRHDEPKYSVTVGQTQVTVRKRGESALRVGTILGTEVQDGRQVIYVDRMLVPPGHVAMRDGWAAKGCISTILIGPEPT